MEEVHYDYTEIRTRHWLDTWGNFYWEYNW